MMNLGAPEMLLLGILALILFGPRRLPELGKALGEGLAAFRESSRQLSGEFKRQLEEETAVPPAPVASPSPDPSPATAKRNRCSPPPWSCSHALCRFHPGKMPSTTAQ